MNEFTSRLSLKSWPIWVKLLAGLLVAALLPLGLSLFLAISSIQEVSSGNVQSFITETAAYHAREVSEIFDDAQDALDTYLASSLTRASLQAVLPFSGETVDPIAKANVVNGLQDSLLNKSNPSFEYIDLLDAKGQLVLHAEPGRQVSIAGGDDLSNSSAYLRGLEAGLAGENSGALD